MPQIQFLNKLNSTFKRICQNVLFFKGLEFNLCGKQIETLICCPICTKLKIKVKFKQQNLKKGKV